ncbi:MAG: periplasmic nitrate reductase, NapE protein [Rhodospirillales bacterium]|nr:periplasmic nitrate reductase, NapE protein [Rhodospirillales bacterium]QPL38127.1 periplasmic nitrate reductase, NapE protein [Thalassospira sp. B30-1]RCK07439.1 nitrate reductase [Thalassospira xianhensis MCCC 1A02616]RCK42414.1 nitrate reductase [Thalassospira xiamenensis]HBN51293.1 periplasmic nitrate reductase, NapE protein [Thalassospira sp.]
MDSGTRRKTELRCFVLLAVVLAPVLAVALVGGLGFSIWIYQMFAGPPGPPM